MQLQKNCASLFELEMLAAFITVEKIIVGQPMHRQENALRGFSVFRKSESMIPNVLQILSQTPCLISQP